MTPTEIYNYVKSLNLQTDKQKIQSLNLLDNGYYKYLIISSLSTDELKIKYLDFSDDTFKSGIIYSMANEENKVMCLDKLTDDKDIVSVAASFSNPKHKIKFMRKIKDNVLKLHLLKGLPNNDNLKLKFIKDETDNSTKSFLISTLSKDEDKLTLLNDFSNDEDKIIIIISLDNDDKKLEYLNQIKNTTFRTLIIASIKDQQKKKELLNIDNFKYSNFAFPQNLSVGLEIECEGSNSAYIGIINNILIGWSSKDDNTLQEGVEVVSPVLYNHPFDVQNIYYACKILKNSGEQITERCGAHVHIGADYLKTKDAYINLLEIWANCEEIIYLISNDTGSIPRKEGLTYAYPLSKRLEDALYNKAFTSNLKTSQFIEKLKEVEVNRLSGLNFDNVNNPNRNINTIEFRISNGTLDPNTWIENINLYGSMIYISQKLSEIKQKDSINRTDEENILLENFNKLKNNNLGNLEKLNTLLNLCIPKELQDTYINRYIANEEKLDSNLEIEEELERKISSKPIIFSTFDIGKTVLTGKNATNGIGIAKTQHRINTDIKQLDIEREGKEIDG